MTGASMFSAFKKALSFLISLPRVSAESASCAELAVTVTVSCEKSAKYSIFCASKKSCGSSVSSTTSF